MLQQRGGWANLEHGSAPKSGVHARTPLSQCLPHPQAIQSNLEQGRSFLCLFSLKICPNLSSSAELVALSAEPARWRPRVTTRATRRRSRPLATTSRSTSRPAPPPRAVRMAPSVSRDVMTSNLQTLNARQIFDVTLRIHVRFPPQP